MDVDVETLRGWLDYDRPYLPHLSEEQRIRYFEKRVQYVVLRPLRAILEDHLDVGGSEPSSALLIFGVSACCAIEALGKFAAGGAGGNWDRFHAFLLRYMDGGFARRDIPPDTNADILWKHFRNGLTHGFAVAHGGFEGAPDEPYFRVSDVGNRLVLKINPTKLLRDLENAFASYLTTLKASPPDSEIRQYFETVFETVFVKGE